MSVHEGDEKGFHLAVVLLAAGAGSRFGGDKLLAPYRSGRLIDASLDAALAASPGEVVVVTGGGAEALALGSSHPTFLVRGWLEQLGPAATMALLKCNNT